MYSVPNGTYMGVPTCQDRPIKGDVMLKPVVAHRVSRRHRRPRPAEFPDVVEGQIEELCRDLAVVAKRMRQLQEQVDELRTVIRQWTGHSNAHSDGDSR